MNENTKTTAADAGFGFKISFGTETLAVLVTAIDENIVDMIADMIRTEADHQIETENAIGVTFGEGINFAGEPFFEALFDTKAGNQLASEFAVWFGELIKNDFNL